MVFFLYYSSVEQGCKKYNGKLLSEFRKKYSLRTPERNFCNCELNADLKFLIFYKFYDRGLPAKLLYKRLQQVFDVDDTKKTRMNKNKAMLIMKTHRTQKLLSVTLEDINILTE